MSRREELLFLVHRVPYPPDKGDRIRSFHILRFLAERFDVDLACLADEPLAPSTLPHLQQFARRVAAVPMRGRRVHAMVSLLSGRPATEGAFFSRELARELRGWARATRYDFVLAYCSSMCQYLQLPELADVPTVVDLVDVDSQKWLDYAQASRGPVRWLYRTEARRLRRLEQEIAARAGAVTLVSEAEAEVLRGFCRDGAIRAVPMGVNLEYFQPRPASEKPACAFVGALDYRPNVQGAVWFCEEVWPALHRNRPDLTFHLVGRRPTAAVRRLANHPGVALHADVPDVRPFLSEASVVVAPLQIARGVQNKVLEALAMGKAVVASPGALEGINARPGEHLLCADTPEAWQRAVSRLLDDAELRLHLGRNGRAFVESHHQWDRCLEPLASLLRSVSGARRRPVMETVP